jgi:hypothetical protein
MTTGVNATPADRWNGARGEPGFCMRHAAVLTPSDAAPQPFVPRQLRIVAGGNIVVQFADSSTAITIAVTTGEMLPWRIKWLYATGTTATVLGLD